MVHGDPALLRTIRDPPGDASRWVTAATAIPWAAGPADLADEKQLLPIPGAEETGITLFNGDQLDPAQSIPAIVIRHPKMKVFWV
jgi:cobalamin-dependent methionine synthase I